MEATKISLNRIKNKNYIYSFERYHTIGINSRPNTIPLLYGCYKNEKAKEFVYSLFLNNNFTVISNLAECDKELSFYYVNKSNRLFINHNLQIGCNEIIKLNLYNNKPRCVGHKQLHKWQLEYLDEALLFYMKKNKRTFSFTSFMEAHEPSFKSITRVDDDFASHLMHLYSINTTLIL